MTCATLFEGNRLQGQDLMIQVQSQNWFYEKGPVMSAVFHLAFNVNDLDEARAFYGDLLGCQEGRSTSSWVDFNFFGNQISLHLGKPFATSATGKVSQHMVLMPHLGVVLAPDEWATLGDRLKAAGVEFVIAPTMRFVGEPGEQGTMFFCDPSDNPIEVKTFADMTQVFAS